MLHLKFLKERANAAEDVSTEQSSPCKNARVSSADENARWTTSAERQERQRPEAGIG